jgi:hypothetical protein
MGRVFSILVMDITARLPKRSVDIVCGSMDLSRGGQMLIHGSVTPVTAGSPVEWLHNSRNPEADDRSDLLDRYLEGWAENNLSKLSSAMAPGYCFDDPHVGQFSRWTISLYFERIRRRFASVGGCTALDLGFFFYGSAHRPGSCGQLTLYREAPRLGLTGVTTITIGELGVVAEAVAYDLNPALDVLRGRPATLVCGLK